MASPSDPRRRSVNQVFGQEPDLQFVATEHVADEEVEPLTSGVS